MVKLCLFLTGSSHDRDLQNNCRDLVPLQVAHCDDMAAIVEITSAGADAAVNHHSCSAQGVKRRVWEASLSSLKSKRVKGIQLIECNSDSNDRNEACSDGCSLATSISKSLRKVTPKDSLASTYMEKNAEESRLVTIMSTGQVCEDMQLKGDCFRIMLMNIADDTKKTLLTEVCPVYLLCWLHTTY